MTVRLKIITIKYFALALLLVTVIKLIRLRNSEMVHSDINEERPTFNNGAKIKFSRNIVVTEINKFVIDDNDDDYVKDENFKDVKVEIIKDIKNDKKLNKYILIWTPFESDIFSLGVKHKNSFKDKKCLINNCVLTDNRTYFGNNIEKFDAIIFNGTSYSVGNDINVLDLPKRRSRNQRYIFYEMRSATEYPVCVDSLNNFFNWTMTYRMDSDVPSPMIVIKNKTGHIVGPRNHMHWIHDTLDWGNDYISNTIIKTKGVIWVEKRCTAINDTKTYNLIHNLRTSLEKYGLDFDIVGKCRMKYCEEFDCDVINKDIYHFYLILEFFDDQDYVTEDLIKYMKLGLIPVVIGRTNFTSFLPPDAYINGNFLSTDEIATAIFESMMNSGKFQAYFRWKKHYVYEKADRTSDVCTLCAALNDAKLLKQQTIYKQFRDWWSQNYLDTCKEIGPMELELA